MQTEYIYGGTKNKKLPTKPSMQVHGSHVIQFKLGNKMMSPDSILINITVYILSPFTVLWCIFTLNKSNHLQTVSTSFYILH